MAKKRQIGVPERPLFDWLDEQQHQQASKNSGTKPAPSRSRPQFPGRDFDPDLDEVRLSKLQFEVFELMKDATYRTHSEVKELLKHGSENGIAAMLRGLRHSSRGKHTVNKRRRGDPTKGLWEYQLIANPKSKISPKGTKGGGQ